MPRVRMLPRLQKTDHAMLRGARASEKRWQRNSQHCYKQTKTVVGGEEFGGGGQRAAMNEPSEGFIQYVKNVSQSGNYRTIERQVEIRVDEPQHKHAEHPAYGRSPPRVDHARYRMPRTKCLPARTAFQRVQPFLPSDVHASSCQQSKRVLP